MSVPFIGLHGRMGSGKDTLYERMKDMFPFKFERVSFADPLKESAAALLGVSVRELDEWKRDETVTVNVSCNNGINPYTSRSMSVRTYLQRYGTEAHRDIFGDDFWINIGIGKAAELHSRGIIPVFTDVRFENEARAIVDSAGILNSTGEIWAINGPVNDTGDHASETPLPVPLVDRFIDNTVRDDAYASLELQLRSVLDEMGVGS